MAQALAGRGRTTPLLVLALLVGALPHRATPTPTPAPEALPALPVAALPPVSGQLSARALSSRVSQHAASHAAAVPDARLPLPLPLPLPSMQELDAIRKVAQILAVLGEQVIPSIVSGSGGGGGAIMSGSGSGPGASSTAAAAAPAPAPAPDEDDVDDD